MVVGLAVVAADKAFFLGEVSDDHVLHVVAGARDQKAERLIGDFDVFDVLGHVDAKHLEVELAPGQIGEQGVMLGMPLAADRHDVIGDRAGYGCRAFGRHFIAPHSDF